MNADNQRLKTIQQLKNGYKHKIEEADNMVDMLHYLDKIDELSNEEKQILERFDLM